jgi:hypothetical protein
MDSHMNTQPGNTPQRRKHCFPAALLSLALAAVATAQQIPFQMQYTQGIVTNFVPNDSLLTLAAPAGQSQTLLIRALYTGTGSVTVTQQPTVTGSAAFTSTINQSLPFTLQPGQNFVFSVRFTPASPAADAARLTLSFAETPNTSVGAIALSLQGLSSAIVPSYVLPADNNVVPLRSGDTIPLPETLVGSTSQASLNLTNIGTTLGQVVSVTISGAAFRLQGLPLFPASLTAGQNLQLQVVYRPTATGPATGSVTIAIVGADPMTVNLRGSAVAPNLTYSVGTTPVSPGGTITLAGIDVGQTSSSVVRIANTGTGPATVNSISVVGPGYQIVSVTPLPQILAPNANMTFTVTFTPNRAGAQAGTLVINSDVFNLNASGLGPALSFSYVSGGATVTLGTTSNSIIFSPVRVSESAQVGLDIRNSGATPVSILNIGIGQANTAFSIPVSPALPLSIAAGATQRVNIKFEPIITSFSTATLIVDNNTFTLTGSGTAPPALPAYSILGPTGTVAPLTQPNVGLRLATAYPVALTGTLTLSPVAGNLPSDPTVQFATGGRTVNFRIPANSTDAIFGTQGTQLGLQTGTVAGAISLRPTFATTAGNLDITPETPLTSQFSVGAAAPSLLSIQVVTPTATGFTVQVTGYATTRTLTALNFELTAVSGFKLATPRYTVDLKALSAAWFQSITSQAFGSQFRISIPFSFQQITLVAGETILSKLSSVSVTATNESGTSTALQTRTQ